MESIEKLINESTLSTIQKNVAVGFVKRAQLSKEKYSADRHLIEETDKHVILTDIILSTDDVKIYKVTGKHEWDIKFPFRSIFLNSKGKWERIDTVSPSLDIAFLCYLGKKYIGSNSQFTDFAVKMLGIKIEE